MIRLLTVLLLITLAACDSQENLANQEKLQQLRTSAPPAQREWRHYLKDKASSQASPLTQINRDNVASLELAWRYDPGDAGDYDTAIPCNPLIIKGVLYGLSASKNLFALDPATGEELWTHSLQQPGADKRAGRGLVYWEGALNSGESAAWLIVGLGHELYAVDALSGERIKSFGDGGSIDLRVGLDRPVTGLSVNITSPGTVYGDLLLQGFGGSETYGAAPGYIRAYHIPSGEIRWTFRTIPASGEFGAQTWPQERREEFGGASSWTGITLDEERGLAFVPTSSPSYDFYGNNRAGDNLFANSLVALDAATGERVWHYQVIRHDLWDRDLPSPPNLITIKRDGQLIPAVSQATKSGHLFVFHRETGEPLFPITEIPVTGPGTPGEHLPQSQPLPLAPPPFANQLFEVSDISPTSAAYISELIAGMTVNEIFRAPDEQGLVIYPGLDGGAEWGGQAWDAQAGMLYVNASEVPWHYTMLPLRGQAHDMHTVEFSYLHFCGGCHGANREGTGDIFPSLKNIGEKYWPWEVYNIIRKGRGRMPSFATEPWYYMLGPIAYLYTVDDDEIARGSTIGEVTGYQANGFLMLRDQHDLPGSKPPWGSIAAIDLNRGEIAWKVPLGDYPQALAMGLSGLGAENYGGPVVTAGGLVFIAATPDRKIRAFDKLTGELLWQATLPAAGFATPAVYETDGRQFVVIAAGGGKVKQPSGSSYVAYALPLEHHNTGNNIK